MITVNDAALLVGRSKATIYRWINAGLPRMVASDGRTYVDAQDVLEWEAKTRPGRPRQ